ncbi:serine hydrolase domain-containing protein [Streptosporangium sp. DT93]|uniref:serine hydrolase domain-containing protein n=1 Tax=Streptosporangium sp. DT93 TaxID=3393428 RepID=UPI003CF71B83
MKRTLIGTAVTIGLVVPLAVAPVARAAALPAEPTPAAVDAYLGEVMESTGLPGMSAVVTHGDRIVHAAGYGRDSEGGPVTARTPMRVASVSKSFTAMAVMTLVDDGRISLDEPVAGQLPGFRMADPRAAGITVRHLLNQTSGLSDTTVDIGAAQKAESLAGYVSALGTGTLTAAPGTRWEYCNVNYDVAARLVEVAGGRGFGDHMRERVFGPLGMTGSTVDDRVVTPSRGFNALYGTWVARSELSGFHAGGSGGVVTTAADMGRWLIAQTGRTGPGGRTVTPESLKIMHTPPAGRGYAMGWGEEELDGTGLLVHSGNLFTYTAVQAIVPETRYGFAVMTNSAALHDDTYDVLAGLVAMSRGRTPEVPGGDRQAYELVLGLVAAAAAGLGVLGVLRARRWARGRAGGRRRWIVARLLPALLPVALFAAYPDLISFLSNGRTVTWEQLTYFAAPLTITLAVVAAAGAVTAAVRLVRLRSVGSSR